MLGNDTWLTVRIPVQPQSVGWVSRVTLAAREAIFPVSLLYGFFLDSFPLHFCRWQIWCSRISTIQTGVKQPEDSGNKATTGLFSSGKLASYNELKCLWDDIIICLHLHYHTIWCDAIRYDNPLFVPQQGNLPCYSSKGNKKICTVYTV